MKIEIGSKIKFTNEKQRFTVIGSSENFTVCTKPLNQIKRVRGGFEHKKTYIYTIIDWRQKKRNRDNLIFGSFNSYNTKSGAKKNIDALEKGEMELSHRGIVELDIQEIINPLPSNKGEIIN
jgi:hypothetical protein